MSPKESYPKYASGQILKSEDLNDSFNYLERHIRTTRNLMIGYGIFNGLSYQIGNDKLTIEKGQALTKDGYVINIDCTQIYDCVVKKEDYECQSDHLSDIDYFFYNKNEADIPKNESITNIQNISEYVLAIIIEIKSNRQKYCDYVSCSITPERIELLPRPVLIKKSKIKTFTINATLLNYVETERLMGVLEFRNLIILRHRMLNNYKKNRKAITDALVSIQKSIPVGFYTDILNNNISTQLKKAINLLKYMADNSTEIPGYYLLFLNDLRLAINEFVSLYNKFVRSYQLFTLYEPKEQLIILGQIPSITNFEEDEYRTAFKQINPDSIFKSDTETLSLAIQRIISLILSFKQKKYHASKETIKIIPSKYFTSKLGEMSIPFYYNDIELSVWQLGEKLSTPVHNHDKFDVNSLTSTFNNDGFFRIDGYFGLKVNIVYNELIRLVEKYKLPFNVVKIRLEKESFSPDDDTSLPFSHYRNVFSKIVSSKHGSIRFPQKWTVTQKIQIQKGLMDIRELVFNNNTIFKENVKANQIDILKKNINNLIINNNITETQAFDVFNALNNYLDFNNLNAITHKNFITDNLKNAKIDNRNNEVDARKKFIIDNLGKAKINIRYNEGLATMLNLTKIKNIISVDGVGYDAISCLTASSLKTLSSCFEKLDPKKVYRYMHGSESVIPDTFYKEKEMLAYMGLENFVRKTIIKDSTGIEYIGGVKANDTLALLYFRDVAILCINMPNYLEKIPEIYR